MGLHSRPNLKKIVQHGGGIVPGLVNRNGHRNNRCQDENAVRPKKKHLNKKTLTEMRIHPSIHEIIVKQAEDENERFNNSLLARSEEVVGLIGMGSEKDT